MFKTLLAAAALTGVAVACAPPGGESPQPWRIVIEAGQEGVEIDPPTELWVRWPGSDGIEEPKFQEACDDMGGRLIWTTEFNPDGEFVCADVDY